MSTSVGWRSTTLLLAERHCPRALDFYEQRAPYDRSVFAVGVSAHAVLEDLGHATVAKGDYILDQEAEDVARQTCERLIEEGRDFEGDPEPPLPSVAVWEGRDLALLFHGEKPARPDFRYEEGVAVSREWQICPYDSGAWLRCRIDGTGTRLPSWAEEEDSGGPRLVVQDFKSSWQDDERALKSMQRKIQAVCSWIAWGAGHESLELQIVNFRARQIHSLHINPREPDGAALLKRWRKDIETEIKARDVQRGEDGLRPASPGPQCGGCPYLSQCSAGMGHLGTVYGGSSPEDLARVLGVAEAARVHVLQPLKAACRDGLLELDGRSVGYHPGEQRQLADHACEVLAKRFLERAKPGNLEHLAAMLPGLLRAAKLGVAQAEALTKYLYEGSGAEVRDRRKRFLGSITKMVPTKEFGFREDQNNE